MADSKATEFAYRISQIVKVVWGWLTSDSPAVVPQLCLLLYFTCPPYHLGTRSCGLEPNSIARIRYGYLDPGWGSCEAFNTVSRQLGVGN